MNANDGPAEIAAKISGVNLGGKREDDSAYFTNNEGHPWPDPYEVVLSEKDHSGRKLQFCILTMASAVALKGCVMLVPPTLAILEDDIWGSRRC